MDTEVKALLFETSAFLEKLTKVVSALSYDYSSRCAPDHVLRIREDADAIASGGHSIVAKINEYLAKQER